MPTSRDRDCLRELAERYRAVTADAIMTPRRDIWRRVNSLQPAPPAIYMRGGRVWREVMAGRELCCEDPGLRGVEYNLRLDIFRAQLGDDTIVEPWLTLRPVFRHTGWGLDCKRVESPNGTGWVTTHPLTDLDDLGGLVQPVHAIDEAATAERVERLQAIIGDLVDIELDRAPWYRDFNADLTTILGHLRGIEQFMYDMYENPDGLHRLMAFLRDGVLAVHDAAEAAGDWGLASHTNQGMPYGGGLADPQPHQAPRQRRELWTFFAAQEFALVSPAMHDEFLLQYQLPIMRHFGLSAYGCCEDLTRKIDMLRQIPNLRRIAVAPAADVAACSEQIGTDYVMSVRPNPAEMVCCGFDEDRIRRIIREDLAICRGRHIDISLKDVDTCEGQVDRLGRWVQIVREEIDRNW